MRHVYGPVPSRRLGQSLGVDPVPFKTCNYNCVYCQLGRTTPVTNERREFYPADDILAEVRQALSTHEADEIDYITVVGEGEPLLYSQIRGLTDGIRALTEIPLAVITNGSLFHLADVRAALSASHVVMPTLDAADEPTFRAINRPWPELDIDEIVEGMAEFRRAFRGQFWIEVMLVNGLNDREPVLLRLAAALRHIGPDQVHLNVPIRPPAEDWVTPPENDGMMRAMAILGEVAPIVTPAEGAFALAPDLPVADAIVQIIRRHPMSADELGRALSDRPAGEVQETLTQLESDGEARRHVYRGQVFWEYSGSRFSDAGDPATTDPQ
jgi:wyosine [tRNA(Phe)-imidazoG37] synthetase (radical SAM superfamily)